MKKNLEKMLLRIQEAAAKGIQLIVFPECALTGYLFRSREEALPYAETIPGPATDKTITLCGKLGVYVVFGLVEIDNGKLFNSAVLAGPDGGQCPRHDQDQRQYHPRRSTLFRGGYSLLPNKIRSRIY